MDVQLSTHLFQEELYYYNTPVLVVLPRPWKSYSEDECTLLNRILTSVNVKIASVRIVVQAEVDLLSLQMYSPAQVLVFGSEAREDMPFYAEIAAQGCTVIRADDLSLLDEQKKKNLWTALRRMFQV